MPFGKEQPSTDVTYTSANVKELLVRYKESIEHSLDSFQPFLFG